MRMEDPGLGERHQTAQVLPFQPMPGQAAVPGDGVEGRRGSGVGSYVCARRYTARCSTPPRTTARCASGTSAGCQPRAQLAPSAVSPASSATRWAAPTPRPCSRPEPIHPRTRTPAARTACLPAGGGSLCPRAPRPQPAPSARPSSPGSSPALPTQGHQPHSPSPRSHAFPAERKRTFLQKAAEWQTVF